MENIEGVGDLSGQEKNFGEKVLAFCGVLVGDR